MKRSPDSYRISEERVEHLQSITDGDSPDAVPQRLLTAEDISDVVVKNFPLLGRRQQEIWWYSSDRGRSRACTPISWLWIDCPREISIERLRTAILVSTDASVNQNLPVRGKDGITRNETRAKSRRASVDWEFRQATYSLRLHRVDLVILGGVNLPRAGRVKTDFAEFVSGFESKTSTDVAIVGQNIQCSFIQASFRLARRLTVIHL